MSTKLKTNIIFFIIIIGILLRIAYIVQFDDYYDDWNFFYTVEPFISNAETWQRHYYGDRGDSFLKEAFPWNFTYFIKFFLTYIGYTVEKTHYLLLLFSILSFFVFYRLCDLISLDFKFKVFAFILFASNLFLIRELNSFRPHSLSILLSLISNYFFIIIFIKKKNQIGKLITYIVSVLLLLSFWPQNLALFGGHCIFLFLLFVKERSNILLYIFPIIIILSLYFVLNYQYIEYIALQNWSYTPLNFKFFVSYFFRSFFGSIPFGGLMLIIFAFFLIKEIIINYTFFKKKSLFNIPFLKLDIESFILTNILTIYLLTISYSFIKESVLAPKYLTILLPLIIIWLSLKLSKTDKNLLYSLVVISAISNSLYYWKDTPIKRAPMRDVLKVVSQNKINKIYTTENIVFNNYLSHYELALKNQIKVLKLENLKIDNSNENFLILCMNYSRAAYGDNYKGKISEKCQSIFVNKKIKILDEIKIPDFLIYIASQKS